jgi:fructokinase
MLKKTCDYNVVVVGDAGVDIIVHFPKFLNEDRTNVEYKTPFLIGGGTAANTAVSLARLGISTSFIGTIGDDQYGKHVIEDFQHEKINTKNVIVDKDVNTVGVFAFIDEYGERYLWGWPRTEQSFKKLDKNKIDFDMIKRADWIHSSGMAIVDEGSSRDTIIDIFKFAYEAGVTTSFDLNLRVNNGLLDDDYKKAVLEIINHCHYVLGSGDEEFFYLNPKSQWEESAKSFVTESRTIIARMGSKGSVAFTSRETIVEKAYKLNVVDTVGAGDVFNGGFIAAKLCSHDLGESIRIANATAGYTVEMEGARSSPNREQLERFIEKHKAFALTV